MTPYQEIVLLRRAVEELQTAHSLKEKQQVLLDNRCPEFERLLCFVLDKTISTGISSAKLARQIDHTQIHVPGGLSTLEVCDHLQKHNTGTDFDIALVRQHISEWGSAQQFLTDLFTKNLKLGVEAATVNKLYGEIVVPVWEVQQGQSIDKVTLCDGEWFALSQKLNGNRGTYYDGQIISRQGFAFTGLEHIIHEIQSVVHDGIVLDGELIRKNTDGKSDNENFTIGTGILNSDEDKSCIEFVIFDIIAQPEFEAGESQTTYRQRLVQLGTLESLIRLSGCQNIRVVPRFYEGCDQSEIMKWLNYAVANNMEGLMLNRDAPYKCKRHNGILKVKRFYTVDLPVVALEEGINKLAGTLGAFVVDFKGNRVRVGSGLTNEMRRSVWSNPEEYIGRIIEIKYKEISRDKKSGLESLQFPIFQRIREQGKSISYD